MSEAEAETTGRSMEGRWGEEASLWALYSPLGD